MKRALLIGLLLLGCGSESAGGGDESSEEDDGKPDEDAPDPGVDPNLRIGHVMVEVGQRLERAGRASEASNWGLAAYEVQEILEMFETDMTRAALPGDCTDAVSDQMYENLLDQLPTLQQAAADEDAAAFRAQFSTASGSCNGCHAGCNVAFIRVPSTPGAEVPMIALPESAPTTPVEEAAEAGEAEASPQDSEEPGSDEPREPE